MKRISEVDKVSTLSSSLRSLHFFACQECLHFSRKSDPNDLSAAGLLAVVVAAPLVPPPPPAGRWLVVPPPPRPKRHSPLQHGLASLLVLKPPPAAAASWARHRSRLVLLEFCLTKINETVITNQTDRCHPTHMFHSISVFSVSFKRGYNQSGSFLSIK